MSLKIWGVYKKMAEDKKSSTKRMIIIILIILLVVNIGGFLIGVKVIIPMFYEQEEFMDISEDSEIETSMESGTRAPGIKKALESINLNPAGSSGEIFSCDIVLEASDQMVADEITARDYEIQDKLATYLSFKTVDELNDPNNWIKFRKDMLNIVNSILAEGEIISIHIPQKIIQFE